MNTDSDGDADSSTANTMGERANESRLKLWVLLRSDRLVLTALITLGFFVAFMVVVTFFFPSFREILTTDDTIDTLFAEILGALITAITLVITISQLVISQEIGPLGDQRDRMSGTMEFRRAISDLIGESTPSDPSTLIMKIIEANEDRANALERAVEDNDNDALREQVEEFVDSLTGNAQEVSEQVEDTSFGTFDVMFAALNYDYGEKIQQIERLLDKFADDISDDERVAFEELRTALTMFSPVREYIKTLYFQWELLALTQNLVYLSIPALFIAGTMVGVVKPTTFPGTMLGISNILWMFGIAFTVTLTPFFLSLVYLLRIATVAKRTLAIGPLLLRGSQL